MTSIQLSCRNLDCPVGRVCSVRGGVVGGVGALEPAVVAGDLVPEARVEVEVDVGRGAHEAHSARARGRALNTRRVAGAIEDPLLCRSAIYLRTTTLIKMSQVVEQYMLQLPADVSIPAPRPAGQQQEAFVIRDPVVVQEIMRRCVRHGPVMTFTSNNM
jgi:hypothetical protein